MLRLGVIGTGAIGEDHIAKCMRRLAGCTVVAVSDVDGARARKVAAAHCPGAAVLADGHAVIKSADVDAVLVTTPGSTHTEYVLAALALGKFAFCEKPLATTAADCRRIVEAEMAVGRRLVQVGFMRPYDPGYRALKAEIAGGGIGQPLMMHCAHRNASVRPGYTTEMAITDTLIHELDVLPWLVGDPLVSAQVIFPRRTSKAHTGLADPQIVLLQTAGGIRIDVEIFVNCQYGYDIQCAVIGETGIASLPAPAMVDMRRAGHVGQAISDDWKGRFETAYAIELQDFVDCCRAGALAGPGAWDGYAASVAADACVAAQKSGAVEPIILGERPSFYAPLNAGAASGAQTDR